MTRKKVHPQGYTSSGSLPSGTEPDKQVMSLASVKSGGDNIKGRRSTGSDKGLQKLTKRITDADLLATIGSQKKQTQSPLMDQKNFKLIKGPIVAQLSLHFLWQGILLIITHFAGWISLYFWALPLYAFLSFCIVETTNVINQVKPESMIPFYLSVIPFAIFHLLSREAHAIFGILWYASIITIALQVGTSQNSVFLVILCLLFIATYAAMSVVLSLAFRPETEKTFLLASELEVQWSQDATCMVAIIAITGSVYFLQSHIVEYAFSLIDRQKLVTTLFYQNVELKRQIKEMKQKEENTLDLDSPITKVIKVIRDIQAKCELADDMQASLDKVVDLLSKNQLFLPNLNPGGKMDAEVSKWLNSMITNQSNQNEDANDSGFTALKQQENLIEVISRPIGIGGKISEVLESIDTWSFNIFELEEVTQGRPLYYLGMHFYEIYNFKVLYQIEEAKMSRFLEKVESSYQKNLYHNSTHAADVMHAVHFFLSTLGLNELVTAEDCFSGLIAASIHDIDHPGVNNAFLINTSAAVALRYNDQAVLENYHASKGFDIIQNEPGCNILSSFTLDKWKAIRGSIVSMVLATDMANHFEYIAKFENKINGTGLDFKDVKDRQLAMDIAIKCGDINNASKPQDISMRWSQLIMEEFFQQGDKERSLGLPISMFMDRETTDIPKCQIGFIEYIVTPLYRAWDIYLNEDDIFEAMDNLSKNKEHWKSLQNTQITVIP